MSEYTRIKCDLCGEDRLRSEWRMRPTSMNLAVLNNLNSPMTEVKGDHVCDECRDRIGSAVEQAVKECEGSDDPTDPPEISDDLPAMQAVRQRANGTPDSNPIQVSPDLWWRYFQELEEINDQRHRKSVQERYHLRFNGRPIVPAKPKEAAMEAETQQSSHGCRTEGVRAWCPTCGAKVIGRGRIPDGCPYCGHPAIKEGSE